MAVRRQITEKDGIYFITFTCYQWMLLFDMISGYDMVYKQFTYLTNCGHYIVGYVIMPNHLHALFAFCNTGKTINTIVDNMKRFMAYDIIEALKQQNKTEILLKLSSAVNATDSKKGQLHEIFEPSFDAKFCFTDKMIEEKLAYMHLNPCRGKWHLCVDPADYIHSSARFYLDGKQGIYPVTSFMLLKDIDLTGRVNKH